MTTIESSRPACRLTLPYSIGPHISRHLQPDLHGTFWKGLLEGQGGAVTALVPAMNVEKYTLQIIFRKHFFGKRGLDLQLTDDY